MPGSRFGWPWRRHSRGPQAGPAATAAAELLPAPRRSCDQLTARLIDQWCTASLAAGWATPGAWWVPEVETVVEAVLDDGDHVTACAALARARAAAGASMVETVDDLGALFAAARLGTPSFATVRGVAIAWAEAAQARIEAAGCVNPRTGLGTAVHVEARLAEMYAEGHRHGFSPSETHALVVVELAVVAEAGNPWDNALRISDVAECLRTVFNAGEVMGLAGPGRVVTVVPRAADLPRTVEALRRMMLDWRRIGQGAPAPIIWVEPLPAGRVAAGRLLSTLCV